MAGRGRGWLNLPKHSPPLRPGGCTPPDQPPPAESTLVQLIRAATLGGAAERKEKQKEYETFWPNDQTKEEIEEACNAIYELALRDVDFGFRCVHVGFESASKYSLKPIFMKRLQIDFEAREQLAESNPLHLHNMLKLLAYIQREEYNYSFLTSAIKILVIYLLEHKTSINLKVAALVLRQNYKYLADLEEVVEKVRLQLFTPNLADDHRNWLVFIYDLLNQNGELSTKLYAFYRTIFGATIMKEFQSVHDLLYVEPGRNSTVLEKFLSDVNVLQISNDNSNDNRRVKPKKKYTAGEKAGRPILGAGARREESEKRNKAWTHDDRLETDYN